MYQRKITDQPTMTTMATHNRPLPHICLVLLLIVGSCVGTRHTFTTHHVSIRVSLRCMLLLLLINIANAFNYSHISYATQDSRHLIGPVGVPFGFLTGGVFNLTVFDFELSIGKKSKLSDPQALKYVEAGFLLKRFDSESDFSKYFEAVAEQTNFCVFESHRSKEYVVCFLFFTQYNSVHNCFASHPSVLCRSIRQIKMMIC